MKTKFIFISGGVISGLGKGITASSLALLLESHGLRVAPIKCDAYMNLDAGTIRPQEHGEVFVTEDGMESDQDIGNYERFLSRSLIKENYLTNGQVYNEIIRKERAFEYDGEDVEIVPHVPEEMIRRFKLAGEKSEADVVIIEIGGTVGEYQNILFVEANRIMKYRDKEDVIHLHVAYLPTPKFLGEMKSKPVQTSVRTLTGTGIQPDFIIGRAESEIDEKRKERIAWLCNIDQEDVISNPDVDSIYKVPQIFKDQGLDVKVMAKLGLKPKGDHFKQWSDFITKIDSAKKKVKLAMVGKYFSTGDYVLSDAYISVIEALKHACWQQGVNPEFSWINSEKLEKDENKVKELNAYDGVVVPGGFGERGVEGIIKAIQFARENKKPYFGLCYGMQLACIELARNKAGIKDANTTEIEHDCPNPIIHLMPEQLKYLQRGIYGATMRLGAYPCTLQKDTAAYRAYGKTEISERHRHRYEFNNEYKDVLEKQGLVIAGTSPDEQLVEVIEIKDHPFFVGVQFHPEFQSRPLQPHPLFLSFIDACLK